MVNQTEYLNGKSTKEQDFNRNRKCNMRDTACSMSDISFSLIGKKSPDFTLGYNWPAKHRLPSI